MSEQLMCSIKDNEKLIYKIASKYSNYYNIDDLYQAGCIGIIKAFKNYDNNSCTKFSTYAYKYILGEMIDFIRKDKSIIVSDEVYDLYKRYLKVKELLSSKYERDISFSEICKYMGIDERYMLNIVESVSLTLDSNDLPKLFDIFDRMKYYGLTVREYIELIADKYDYKNNLPPFRTAPWYMQLLRG